MNGSEEIKGFFGVVAPWLDQLSGVIDLLSIAVLLIGAARFTLKMVRGEFASENFRRLSIMNTARRELGSYILAGLELLIVSDVIHTAITLDLDGLLFLGGLVIIRAIIGLFLEREIRVLSEVSYASAADEDGQDKDRGS
ncbi:MAG: DUF1622 domain-containing protein [Hoeflea sp.]|uniref:DUF1622 domain-containing protein n=1 Tax=Hoeflea sp. TaxID=1940281 RepID=UPI001D432966|nr:DUF1622 domain-containing protein [Hoeflea sp.]MBU4531023.1 DUF1622 domain-containing protein [Alphaproteobacteria bacterium]MBU4542798.1 DUF1622 domain-containing protein [Alphaproteobacteria bacterium]MBU4552610.1 DUF1622 domain-containing protein [Alphaproteobacteria bacterium]MBV1722915.1 DUF1622 domain-containing protein [Hoeflea sp.]MBV1762826.1 DUF1622 domain-containing protein [Hoeflea sp.]